MTDAGAGAVRGVGVLAAARAGAGGRVVSVHGKAVYLEMDGSLIALVSAGLEAGPLHLRSGPLPPAVAGERVTCDGSRIAARAWAVRCDVPVWEGALPDPWPAVREVGTGSPDGVAGVSGTAGEPIVTGAGEPETAIPGDVPVAPGAVHEATRAGAVEDLARLLGGRGPGLTPAGDDLLAGLVLAARARWGTVAQSRLVTAVDAVRTTRQAQAFLHWAARGQCLAPAHDVLVALAGGDTATEEGAGQRLESVGASSGRCLLAGLRIGAAQLPRLDTQSTRAGAEVAL